MTGPEDRDEALEALFAGARARRDAPPADLVARVLADAGRVRRGVLSVLLGALGGWPAAAGLAAASAAGLLVGYVAPEAVPLLGPALAGYELIDLAPGYPVLADLGG